jgi:Pyridoxal phosphate biosynthesis protein
MNLILKNSRKRFICVTIGDIDGIGIHLLIKEFKKKNIKNFIILTNIKIFTDTISLSTNKINLIDLKKINEYDPKKLNILTYTTKNKYTNTLDSLKLAYKLTKNRDFIGILTLPLNKNKIQKKVDKNFIDQTTFFSKKEKKTDTNMIFIHNEKFFIPLTIHIEIKNVHNFFKNKRKVIKRIESLFKSLKNDFKIKDPPSREQVLIPMQVKIKQYHKI